MNDLADLALRYDLDRSAARRRQLQK